jgi:hypothetical protein
MRDMGPRARVNTESPSSLAGSLAEGISGGQATRELVGICGSPRVEGYQPEPFESHLFVTDRAVGNSVSWAGTVAFQNLCR